MLRAALWGPKNVAATYPALQEFCGASVSRVLGRGAELGLQPAQGASRRHRSVLTIQRKKREWGAVSSVCWKFLLSERQQAKAGRNEAGLHRVALGHSDGECRVGPAVCGRGGGRLLPREPGDLLMAHAPRHQAGELARSARLAHKAVDCNDARSLHQEMRGNQVGLR